MASKGILIWICTLAVLSTASASDDTVLDSCSSQTQLLDRLSAELKVAAECADTLADQRLAELLLSARNLTDALHRHQLKGCQGAEPKNCSEAEVPNNGGLVCITVADKRYCKPLCNYGYDFGFIRRSRLFEECSNETGYKWLTQYVGGNRLAVCSEMPWQVSGAKSAYFPKDQDCLTTKASSQLYNATIEAFASELKSQGVQGEPQHACLVCGDQDVVVKKVQKSAPKRLD